MCCAMTRSLAASSLRTGVSLAALALWSCVGIGYESKPMTWNPENDAKIEGMNAKGEETQPYRLGAGDKIRVTVFGADRLSGVFPVELSGAVAMPLVGILPAGGKTLDEVKGEIVKSLKEQKLMDKPNVSVAMVSARPFYVLGEVGRSGSYPYVGGTNIESAIATAGGFSYRAQENYVFLRRAGRFHEIKVPLPSVVPINPGDIVRVGSRVF
ncbi:MAG TPA: polysaccharide biosynthesis/export family protein [Stellaceae bacterium]|nr:polysaccharide biosynthesis/export family protein [Stellaceae bacterium]